MGCMGLRIIILLKGDKLDSPGTPCALCKGVHRTWGGRYPTHQEQLPDVMTGRSWDPDNFLYLPLSTRNFHFDDKLASSRDHLFNPAAGMETTVRLDLNCSCLKEVLSAKVCDGLRDMAWLTVATDHHVRSPNNTAEFTPMHTKTVHIETCAQSQQA